MIQYDRIPEVRVMCEELLELINQEYPSPMVGVVHDLVNVIITLSYDVEKVSEYRDLLAEWVAHDQPDGSGWSFERIERAQELLGQEG